MALQCISFVVFVHWLIVLLLYKIRCEGPVFEYRRIVVYLHLIIINIVLFFLFCLAFVRLSLLLVHHFTQFIFPSSKFCSYCFLAFCSCHCCSVLFFQKPFSFNLLRLINISIIIIMVVPWMEVAHICVWGCRVFNQRRTIKFNWKFVVALHSSIYSWS